MGHGGGTVVWCVSKTQPVGFEPTQAVPIGFQVQPLNHSGMVARIHTPSATNQRSSAKVYPPPRHRPRDSLWVPSHAPAAPADGRRRPRGRGFLRGRAIRRGGQRGYHSSRSTRREAEARNATPDVAAVSADASCAAASLPAAGAAAWSVQTMDMSETSASPLSLPGWFNAPVAPPSASSAPPAQGPAQRRTSTRRRPQAGQRPFGGTGAARTAGGVAVDSAARLGLAAAEPWRRTLFPAPARALRSPCHNVMERVATRRTLNCATPPIPPPRLQSPPAVPSAAPRRGAAAPPRARRAPA